MFQNSLPTQLPETPLDAAAEVEAQLQERRANFAGTLSKIMAGAVTVLILLLGAMWLLSPNHVQLVIYAIVLGVSLIGFLAYPTFSHRGNITLGASVFLLGFLVVVVCTPLFLPHTLAAVGVGYVFIILMSCLLLGAQIGLWSIAVCALGLAFNIIAVEMGVENWFPALDQTTILISTLGVCIVALPTSGVLIRMIVVAQEEQFRRAQIANLEIEQRVKAEQEQREQLEQANLEVEKRAAAEQEQREQLQRLVAQVQLLIGSLNAAAAEIQAASTQQLASATEQDTSVTQTVATVEEIRSTVQQTAERAQTVANAARQSVEVSRRGEDAVDNSVNGMKTIQQRVENIAETILTLSGRTQQIGEIINTVNTLADQSKLLALNASIEAARAGEEGRGFAVVAMEVRQLAEQSRQATARIGEILNDIQQATNTAVMVTEEGSKGAERGMELVTRAGEAIRELAAVLAEVTQAAVQIAASTHQQTNGMDQLAAAMLQIKQASNQAAASSRQTEQSMRDLNHMARQLTETATHYQPETN